MGENVGASKGLGNPFQKTDKGLRQRHFPFLLGLSIRGFQVDDLVLEVQLIPSQTQNLAFSHASPISQLDDDS